MQYNNDLEEFMNLKHIRRLILEQTVEITKDPNNKMGEKEEILEEMLPEVKENLLEFGEFLMLDFSFPKTALIKFKKNKYKLKLKSEES